MSFTHFELRCSYCGHDLSSANPIQYINGEPICLMCMAKLNSIERATGDKIQEDKR
jgi:formylmethanofuran dehydrogenase subunit E